MVLDMKPIRFGELIRQTNGGFEEKFAARGLQMVCKMDEEPLVIMADGRRMWRVVENLYNNIAKYAMPNTRVYVEAKGRLQSRAGDQEYLGKPVEYQGGGTDGAFYPWGCVEARKEADWACQSPRTLWDCRGTFDIYLDGDLFKVVITFEAVDKES